MIEEGLNPVDSQYLLIQVLKTLGPEVSSDIAIMFGNKKLEPLEEFILACIVFGKEIRKNPDYCSTFECTCKTMLAKQKSSNEKEISKKECWEALGWSSGVQLNRIEHGTARMKKENLSNLYNRFNQECDRKFWKNYLLTFFPDTLYDYDSKIEYDGLVFVLKSLKENDYQLLSESLPEAEMAKINSIFDDFWKKEWKDSFGVPPFQLYKTINHLVKQSPSMTIRALVEDELQTTLVSWYEWKVKWEKAEKGGFEYLPVPRLQRRHLLLIAVVFRLEYLDAVRLLQIGGYRVGMARKDRTIVNYFLRGRDKLDELKYTLQNGNIS